MLHRFKIITPTVRARKFNSLRFILATKRKKKSCPTTTELFCLLFFLKGGIKVLNDQFHSKLVLKRVRYPDSVIIVEHIKKNV